MAKNDDVTIQAKAETVEGEKAKAQQKDAEKIREKAAEAARKADEAHAEAERRREEAEKEKKRLEEERRKAAEEAAKKAEAEAKAAAEAAAKAQKEAEDRNQQVLAAAGTLLAGAAGAAAKSKTTGSFLKGLVAGVLVGAIVMFLILKGLGGGLGPQLPTISPFAPNEALETADVVLETNAVTFTAADFQEAVLGGCSEHQELIVMEQELAIPTTVTKAGLGGLSIFTKMKTITYHGSGIYTVDLSRMDADHIDVSEAERTVTVRIPHASLQYVVPDMSATEFEDTEKGLLAFGDIKLTAEQQKELEVSVTESMRERLTQPDMFALADEYATLKTWEIFQPLISAVSPEYKVVVTFE